MGWVMVVLRRALAAMAMLLAFETSAAWTAERPPQFVVMAFDNCTELTRWRELADFAADMKQAGKPVHFTFFVSGINFLSDAKRDLYQGPRQRRGASNINFGGAESDVRARLAFINTLHQDGHEIASHAVGHFDGGQWTAADWTQELRDWRQLLAQAAPNNELSADAGIAFPVSDAIGFRAPYLRRSAGLDAALAASDFRYDASGTMPSDRWPEKTQGLWRFSLAIIPLHGTSKRPLSMDYNFLVAQSLGKVVPERAEEFRAQMLRSYLGYFEANYTGNRAPIHIGHHFTAYQGGVYNEALKDFARTVCGLPEVQCTTYARLAAYLDTVSEPERIAFQAGAFPHASMPQAFPIRAAQHDNAGDESHLR